MNIKAIFLATILGVTTYNQANAAHHIHPCTVEWQTENNIIVMKLSPLDKKILSREFIGSKAQIHRLIKPLQQSNSKWKSIADLLTDILYQTKKDNRQIVQKSVSSIYDYNASENKIFSKEFSYDLADKIMWFIKSSYKNEFKINPKQYNDLYLYWNSQYTFYGAPKSQIYSDEILKKDQRWDRVLTLYNHVYQIGLESMDDTIIKQVDTLITTQLSKMHFTAENEEHVALKLICALIDNDKFSDIFIDMCYEYQNFIDLLLCIDILDMMIKRYRE